MNRLIRKKIQKTNSTVTKFSIYASILFSILTMVIYPFVSLSISNISNSASLEKIQIQANHDRIKNIITEQIKILDELSSFINIYPSFTTINVADLRNFEKKISEFTDLTLKIHAKCFVLMIFCSDESKKHLELIIDKSKDTYNKTITTSYKIIYSQDIKTLEGDVKELIKTIESGSKSIKMTFFDTVKSYNKDFSKYAHILHGP